MTSPGVTTTAQAAGHPGDAVTIRLATLDDLPAIVAISNHYALTTHANFAVEPESLESWRESWRTTHERFPWLVAVETPSSTHGPASSATTRPDEAFSSQSTDPSALRASPLLGFAKASPWKGRCAYNWTAETSVYLRPEAHGRGLGRALYSRLINLMRAQGWRTLLGGITQPNEASVRLHEACGFRKVAHLERVGWKFGRWWDVGYWELHLQGDPSGTMDDPPPGPIEPVKAAWRGP
ncbi:MAG: N-acetyltransferase family protein [Phycisphaeraceae bacterium]|nr:GNAT family N-acetyltransferase [Phycisphaerales bacterium]QOJ17310.1 MAG: N-acetyltransferase family protein [Phycisphaeraceae bacterium]